MKASRLLGATCLVALMHHVAGFGKGAPTAACEDLVPQHKVEARKTACPYLITVDKRKIKAGDTVTLIINGKNGEPFKGFACQARVGNTIVGHFEPANGVKTISCKPGQQNTATHTGPEDKTKIVITWVASQDLSEPVKFFCTVAKDGGTFWVAEQSETIMVN